MIICKIVTMVLVTVVVASLIIGYVATRDIPDMKPQKHTICDSEYDLKLVHVVN